MPAGVITTLPSSPHALRLPWVPRTRPPLRIARPAVSRSRRRSAADGTGDRLLVGRLEHPVFGDFRGHELVGGHVEGHVHGVRTRRRHGYAQHARHLVAGTLLDLDRGPV